MQHTLDQKYSGEIQLKYGGEIQLKYSGEIQLKYSGEIQLKYGGEIQDIQTPVTSNHAMEHTLDEVTIANVRSDIWYHILCTHSNTKYTT